MPPRHRRTDPPAATYVALVLLLLGALAAFVVWLAASGIATELGTNLAHRWLGLPVAVRAGVGVVFAGAAGGLAAFEVRRQRRRGKVSPPARRRSAQRSTTPGPAPHPPIGDRSSQLTQPPRRNDGEPADIERQKYGPKPAAATHGAAGRTSLKQVAAPGSTTNAAGAAASLEPAVVATVSNLPAAHARVAEPPSIVRSVVQPVGAAVGQRVPASVSPPAPAAARLVATLKVVFGSGTPSTTPTATPTELADRLWYPPGRKAPIGSAIAGDGMLYVGQGLPSVSGGFATEAALVDPDLPRVLPPGGVAPTIPYWPSYAGLSPEARGYYVHWLLGGRQDPATPIGYVFLFFYGIERRLLADSISSESARAEAPALLAEVARLLAIYGQNGSFQSYATDFLVAVRAQRGLDAPLDITSALGRRGPELPLGVRVVIGQLVATARPIPADLAFAWVCGHPETRLRTAARRCERELRELFAHRYKAQFGTGMTLDPNKKRLSVEYRPASPSFAGSSITIAVGDLPDIAALSKPVNALRTLFESCLDDLEGLSRLLGRSAAEASSIRGLTFLPKELLQSRETPELVELRTWLNGIVPAEQPALVPARELSSRLAPESPEIRKADFADAARLLETLGFGVEPDVRFGARAPKPDEPVALFRTPPNEAGVPTAAFHAAGLVLRLAAEVAASDEEINDAEQEELEAQLERALDLEPGERRRLRAHLKWLVVARPGLVGLKKHLERLDSAGRSRIAQYAVAIAGADGHIDPAEVKTLQKIYRALGLEPSQVFADVHNVQASATRPPTEPVTIQEAVPGPSGFRVPDAPPTPRTGVVLDRHAIERKLVETAAVSSLLSRIFVDEDSVPEPPPQPKPDHTRGLEAAAPLTVAGLDQAGCSLLRALADLQTISRSDFEALAAERGMLPDGALETLNEAAFQCCNEPALEGDDPIEVNGVVIKEMLG